MQKKTRANSTNFDNAHNSLGLNIIAIGASAGGLEALQEFLSHFPVIENTSIIIAQHLSPTHKSMLVQLLKRETNLKVEEALNHSLLISNTVYITPPDKNISISKNKIILSKPLSSAGPKPSVDFLFNSFEGRINGRLIGIILSGTGSDGAVGLGAIKLGGGLTIVQDPLTAKYDGMPKAAIESGNADIILSPEKMGEEIKEFITNAAYVNQKIDDLNENHSGIEKIIKLLSNRTGTDFSNYKSATINRRLEKRLEILKIKSIEDYLVLLEKNPRELDEMFNIVLIGVTTFFRDIESFGILENYLHKIINSKTNKDSIRIWVPGCSTGEEAYSIAILLHRILKERVQNHTIQIFATDIDERAIAHARKGIYSTTSLQDIPAQILDEYFLKKGKDFELVKSIRSMVLFTKHDLTNNPPFLKLDLISCRNLLIYFGSVLQKQIIPVFHYALLQEGYLFLGRSESIGSFTDLFSPIDAKNRFYQRKRGGHIHSLKFSSFKSQKQALPTGVSQKLKTDLSVSDLVKETLFNTYEHPYVIINDQFDIIETNGDLRLFLSLPQGMINVNLLKMINLELQIETRSIITRAIKERQSVKGFIKKFELFNSIFYVRITAKPLIYTETNSELYIVIFESLDLGEFISKGVVSSDSQLVDGRMQELEHELAATKEHLQTYIEELETSNEEMQSLNEEMQSTNEELQSTNEELETSNEELQSTNEEIQITYSELKVANEELERKEKLLIENEANVQALLNNTLQAFILIDNGYRIMAFNEKAIEIFFKVSNKKLNLNGSFIDFINPTQLEKIIVDFGKVTTGQIINKEIKIKDNNQIEKWFSASYTPVFGKEKTVTGISIGMLDITDLKIALSELNDKQRLIGSVFDATSIGICITDAKGRFLDVNDAYCSIYGYAKEELIGNNFSMMVSPSFRLSTQKLHDEFIESGIEMPSEWEVIRKDGTAIKIFVTASLLIRPDGSRCKVTSVRDITLQKLAEKEVLLLMNNTDEGFVLLDKKLNITLFNRQAATLYKKYLGVEINLGDPVTKLTEPEYIESLRIICNEVLSGAVKDSEMDFKILDGTVRTFAFHFIPARDNFGVIEGIFITGKDITEAKVAQYETQKIMDSSLDVICTIDEQGRFVKISKACLDIWGYTPQELVGEEYIKLVFQDDISLTIDAAKDIMLGINMTNFENRYTKKDGSIIPMVWSARWDNEEKLMYCIAKDATEKKAQEKERQLREQRFKSLVQDGSDLIGIIDHGGNYKYVSPTVEQILGYNVDEFIEKNAFDFIHPDDKEIVLSSLLKIGEIKKITLEPFRFVNKKGEYRWIETTLTNLINEPAINGIVSNSRDVTDRLQQQKQLEVSQTLLSEAQRLAKMGSWNFDFKSDYLTWSDELYNVFETDRNTFLGTHKSFIDFVDPEYREYVFNISEEAKQTGEPFTIVYEITTSKGIKKVIEECGYSEKDSNGDVFRLFGTAQDITERNEAEFRIKEANERYKYVTEATSEIIWDWDLNTDKVYYANNFEKLLGYPISERKNGLPFYFDSVHEEDKEKVLLKKEDFRNSDKTFWEEEYRIRKTDGSYAFIVDKGIVIKNNDGIGIRMVGSIRDISKQKEEQQYLKLLSSVITNANDTILITEAEPINGVGPKILYVNQAFTKLTGYTKEEVIGKTPRILQGPKTDRRELDRLRRALEEWQPCEVTVLNYRKSGEEFWINLSVTPIADDKGWFTHWIAIKRDVTLVTLQSLQKSLMGEITSCFNQQIGLSEILNDVLKILVEFSDFEIGESFLFTPGNKRFEKVSSYTKPLNINSFHSGFDNINFESLKKLGVFKREVYQPEYVENLKENKASIYYEEVLKAGFQSVSYVPLVDKNHLIGIFAFYSKANKIYKEKVDLIFSDISSSIAIRIKRKQEEKEMIILNESLNRQKSDLERSNKELEQFAFVASHDLQEPLRMVTSFLSQLEKKYNNILDERGKKYIDFAVDASLRMRKIILDLLEYSRAGRQNEMIEEVDINDLIEEIEILLQKEIIEKNAKIHFEKLPKVSMNQTPLRQVLQNLIENALKYSKETVIPVIRVQCKENDSYWEISVKDNSVGIQSEYFEKIFVIFQRLDKNKTAGTGLGLAISKKIIESHGGKIWVESEEGIGSTFFFTIPK